MKHQYKYLGVVFTHNMPCSERTDYITAKSLKQSGRLRRTLRVTPKETQLLMQKTLIRPIPEYASMVWNPYGHFESNKIEFRQRKAARFAFRRYDYRNIANERHPPPPHPATEEIIQPEMGGERRAGGFLGFELLFNIAAEENGGH